VIDKKAPVLRGRQREQAALDGLLRDVVGGKSRVLVLRGEAGVGKTALLDYLADAPFPGRVVRAGGVEAEMEIAYSALQQVCAPVLDHLDRLPDPQRAALSTGLGLSGGNPPEPLLVGLAVLGLFAEAAADRPLVCVVDDVQWVDRMSEVILTFVARRLDSESVALVFAARTPDGERILAGLPELHVGGLADVDARALLESVLPGPVDEQVRDRIVAESRGNPLALLELPHGLTQTELAFGFGGLGAFPVVNRIEAGFHRRITDLPPDARMLLLVAAVEPVGDVPLLWRALALLGIGAEAAAAATSSGLVEFGTRVRFRHPLVRSASWRSVDPALLRRAHGALAEATDAEQDPDRRAWHRAHAAIGTDEDVAAELERCAQRALLRGGYSAAASFLERAAALTPEPKPRASRTLAAAGAYLQAGAATHVAPLLTTAALGLLDPLQQIEVERLRAQVAFAVTPGRAAGPPLLAAARRLATLDVVAARATCLSALGVAIHAGPLGGDDQREAAQTARALPPGEENTGLLLTGLATWVLDGNAAAAAQLARAVAALTEDVDPGLLWLAVPAAQEIFDDRAWHELTEKAVAQARRTGRSSVLPSALSLRAGALLHAGQLTEAAGLIAEMEALAHATGLTPDPSGALNLVALRGREEEALNLIEAIAKDAEVRDDGRAADMASQVKAMLFNGLGRYQQALDAARAVVEHRDLGFHHGVLFELAEAAARVGEHELAARTAQRLTTQTGVAGTPWARGLQALADALVDPNDAAFEAAVDLLAPVRLGVLGARARLLYGEWLRRQGRRADARAQLRVAHEAFTAMGVEGFAQRAARELTATGETVRKRVVGSAMELTPQEWEIARLAKAGHTNSEIAAVLFLSPRTVEWHLRKVFTKLDITSRRQLRNAIPEH
jgi:DNA-binding CsgD family transcriptional regulator